MRKINLLQNHSFERSPPPHHHHQHKVLIKSAQKSVGSKPTFLQHIIKVKVNTPPIRTPEPYNGDQEQVSEVTSWYVSPKAQRVSISPDLPPKQLICVQENESSQAPEPEQPRDLLRVASWETSLIRNRIYNSLLNSNNNNDDDRILTESHWEGLPDLTDKIYLEPFPEYLRIESTALKRDFIPKYHRKMAWVNPIQHYYSKIKTNIIPQRQSRLVQVKNPLTGLLSIPELEKTVGSTHSVNNSYHEQSPARVNNTFENLFSSRDDVKEPRGQQAPQPHKIFNHQRQQMPYYFSNIGFRNTVT